MVSAVTRHIVELYQQIVEASGYVIYTTNRDGIFTSISQSVFELTGYTEDEVLNQSYLMLIDPEWHERVQGFYRTQYRQKQSETTLEFPIVTRDGQRKWIEQTVIALDGDNPEIAYQAIVHDVTARHNKEQARRQEQARYRTLFDITFEMLLLHDGESIVEVNPSFEQTMGVQRAEAVGSPVLHFMIPDERKAVAAKLTTHQPQNFETVALRKDGSSFPIEVLTKEIVYQDRRVYAMSLRDISRRKEAEARLAEGIQQLELLREVDAELADRLDINYVLVMALDSAVRLSGANVGFIGLLDEEQNLTEVRVVGDYSIEATRIAHRKGQGIAPRVVRNLTAELVMDVSIDPDYIAINPRTKSQISIPLVSQERLIGVLSLESHLMDRFNYDTFEMVKLVTARIAAAIDNALLHNQTEVQLLQLRDLYTQVSKLEQLKTDMIRVAAHDLRNPLSAISGFIELIMMDWPQIKPDELRDFMTNMDNSVRRMTKIIMDILSLERIEAAVNEAEYKTCDLAGIVRDMFEECREQSLQKQQQFTLKIETDEDAPPIVKGQAAELREAVINLMNNAIKYTPDKGQVDVRLYSEGGRLHFTVNDTGYGIPQNQQERLFQPFYRAISKETMEIEGTGLGLHLVKKIVERHKGRMIFESEHGKGSTFGFTLPLSL